MRKRTETHDDQCNGKGTDCALVFDHPRNCGDDQDDVANHRNEHGDGNGLETAPVGIGKVGTEEWRNIAPSEDLSEWETIRVRKTYQN